MIGKSGIRLAAGIGMMALVASACSKSTTTTGGASAPGVTATTITIGSHQPLTGPAAPGYSEVAPAAKAFFDFVNSGGGVNGRTITYKYVDDGYNPTNTISVVRQLVLQDNVFAIFNGLGTPTHSKVLDFLKTNNVPDLFVASGCQCWDNPSTYKNTFGWQPDYVREGKILGKYIAATFPGKKIAYFFQDDDFGKDGVKGLDQMIPAAQVVTRQSYQPGNTDVGPAVGAIAAAKADVVVSFSIPAYTALLRLVSLKLNINPQLVVSNVGSDPTTLTGLLEAFARKGGFTLQGNPLIQGIITDAYLPPTGDTSNSWIALFKKVHDQYIPSLPFDGNVEYGMAAAYTFVQAVKAAGKNLTRAGLVAAVEKGGFTGPGLVPFAFSGTSHAGYTGAQIGTITGPSIVVSGDVFTTDDGTGAITPYTGTQPAAPTNGIPAS